MKIRPSATGQAGATPFAAMLDDIWEAAGGGADALERLHTIGDGALPSVFAVSDLAAASVAAAGFAIADWIAARSGAKPRVSVDRRLASFWFGFSLRPHGWSPPPPWDPIAGDYATADGWIRLHTNAPHHRDAALKALGVGADKASVAGAVVHWTGDALEAAIVAGGGCGAKMRSIDEWAAHEQGRSVAAEPLIATKRTEKGATSDRPFDLARPLAGVRVLDLTRVLAGPVATRFFAGYGADVLRIDPLDWEEPGVIPEVVLGKRSARLDLRQSAGRAALLELLVESDVFVHGYRADALERLGLGADVRRAARPGLVDVCLDAYGWSGPWRGRRGFDSLVQMSAGVADAGMRRLGKDRPTPLPVQALDQATGYMMATAAALGLTHRLRTGEGSEARLSLARTCALLTSHVSPAGEPSLRAEGIDDVDDRIEDTAWGPARRLRAPVAVTDALGPPRRGAWRRCAALGRVGHAWRERRSDLGVENLVGPHPERLQLMRSERVDQRDVGGVAAPRDDDAADAANIVARIERAPLAIEEHFHPGAEIHRVDDGHADVAKMAIDVTRGNVEATAESDGEMGEIATDADPLVERLERSASRSGLLIIELDMAVHEVANRLHASPSWRRRSEHVPGRLTQPVGFAIAAAHEIDEALVGQVGDGNFLGVRNEGVELAVVFDRGVAPERQIAHRGDEPTTDVAE
jgi:CoA-transferase family III